MRAPVAVALALFLVGACSTSSAPHAPGTTAAAGSAAGLASNRWGELPPAPIPVRNGASATWTGRELLVWGGFSGEHGEVLHGDGAAWNPTTRHWRILPPSPLGARDQHAAVWTGQEWIIWGGYDLVSQNQARVVGTGAAYDPASDRWQTLPPSPLAARADATAVWTGTEAIFISGHPAVTSDAIQAFTDAAAYDPAQQRWRPLPALPIPAPGPISLTAVWTGTEVIVWTTSLQGPPETPGYSYPYRTFTFRPSADHWQESPFTGDTATGIEQAYWIGSTALIPAAEAPTVTGPPQFGRRGHRYDPVGNSYTAIAHGPVDDLGRLTAWTGHALVTFAIGSAGLPGGEVITYGDAAAWDPATDRWLMLEKAPLWPGVGTQAVWAGTELFLVGGLLAPGREPSSPTRTGSPTTTPAQPSGPAATLAVRLGP